MLVTKKIRILLIALAVFMVLMGIFASTVLAGDENSTQTTNCQGQCANKANCQGQCVNGGICTGDCGNCTGNCAECPGKTNAAVGNAVKGCGMGGGCGMGAGGCGQNKQ